MREQRKIHPVANIITEMENGQYQRLVASIKKFGLVEPIEVIDNGWIIDGRHRERACLDLGIEGNYKKLGIAADDIAALVEHSLIKNVDRRHLTASARAMIAADVREYLLKHGSMSSLSSFIGTDESKNDEENAALGASMNVSKTYIQRALNVRKRGCKELENAVRRNKITVTAADRLSTFPPAIQRRVLEDGSKAVKEFLKNPTRENEVETTETRMADWNKQCQQWCVRLLSAIKEMPSLPIVEQGVSDTIVSHLQAAVASMKSAKSYALCPRCDGEGCGFCFELGFVNRVTYESNHN